MVQLIWPFCLLYLFSCFGHILIFLFIVICEMVTTEFMQLYNGVCKLDWYLISMDKRKMFPCIILITQQPIILHSFVQFLCTREAFKNVSGFFV